MFLYIELDEHSHNLEKLKTDGDATRMRHLSQLSSPGFVLEIELQNKAFCMFYRKAQQSSPYKEKRKIVEWQRADLLRCHPEFRVREEEKNKL